MHSMYSPENRLEPVPKRMHVWHRLVHAAGGYAVQVAAQPRQLSGELGHVTENVYHCSVDALPELSPCNLVELDVKRNLHSELPSNREKSGGGGVVIL